MDFENWLKTLADEGGSDLYLTTGAPPSAKFDGELKPLSDYRWKRPTNSAVELSQ